jgi:hypothetical protein
MPSRSAGRAARAGELATLAVALAVLSACSSAPNVATDPATAGPTDPATAASRAPVAAGSPSPVAGTSSEDPVPTGSPSPTLLDTGSAIVAGSVDRTSLDLSATYRIDAAITVRTGDLDVATEIVVVNDSGNGIDRLELNTIAARLGRIDVTSATVDGTDVSASVADQTLLVPLGGVLPAGASATVRIEYRATLARDLTGSDWMFSRAGGTLALYRWIPWVSRAVPFDRPNHGDPFVTPSSPRVEVELLVDEPMVLAAPAASVDEVPAGPGRAWSFALTDVRDVSIVLAPDFRVTEGDVDGLPIRVYTRPGGLSGTRVLTQAVHAVSTESAQLGMAYPAGILTVAQTQGGYGLESPGLIWIPRDVDALNLAYLVHHETAHQWFYGLVGNDQQAEPFTDEAAADLLARTVLGTLRKSRCPMAALDQSITAYSETCYYEVIYVQGGLVLDEIRRKMGNDRFWGALAVYLQANRHGLAGTTTLLDVLRGATSADLGPILRSRFPHLFP